MVNQEATGDGSDSGDECSLDPHNGCSVSRGFCFAVGGIAVLLSPLCFLVPGWITAQRQQGLYTFAPPPVVGVRGNSLTQGWSLHEFPHAIANSSVCRNPVAYVRPESGMGYWRDAYFCDPDGALTSGEAALVGKRLVALQKSVLVRCGLEAEDTRPFFLAVAVVRRLAVEVGEGRESSERGPLRRFARGLLNRWDLGDVNRGEQCSNTAALVVSIEQRLATVVSGGPFVDAGGEINVALCMGADLRLKRWAHALARGIECVQEEVERGPVWSGAAWVVVVGTTITLGVGLLCAAMTQVVARPGSLATTALMMFGAAPVELLVGCCGLAPGMLVRLQESRWGSPLGWVGIYCVLVPALATVWFPLLWRSAVRPGYARVAQDLKGQSFL